ncbi:MAG: cation transporter [Ignavibacteria bacterium CG2_30_36_16]|nr:MAG: cation transporter [Ignavibacteria bacterium CG2_30_36_16]
MEHSHNHSNNISASFNKAFGYGISLNIIYIIVEVVFGLMVNSMALLADAGHNFSDVLGLILAWGAAMLAQKSPTTKTTYGLRKSTILAALFNGILLMIAVGGISIEAIRKLINPEPVQGATMMIVAGVGVIINAATALLFIKGKEKDINIKGAYLHMTADAGVSFGVVAAGFLIYLTNWLWLDPAVSLLIVVVITISTWGLLRDSFMLSVDAVPSGIQLEDVKKYLEAIPGVEEVHDIHIWGMSTTETALTAHLVIPTVNGTDEILKNICKEVNDKFEIAHCTIQFERSAKSASCTQRSI